MEVSTNIQPRLSWGNPFDYFVTLIGLAGGSATFMRFPYFMYRYGGASFLLPYFLALLSLGFPLLYLELALGQSQKNGLISLWGRVCPMFKGIGYVIILLNLMISIYFNTIIGWTVYYFFASLRSVVPWAGCSNEWNTAQCIDPFNTLSNSAPGNPGGFISASLEYFENAVLGSNMSLGLDHIGEVMWAPCLCLLAVFVVIYLVTIRGVWSIGKVMWAVVLLSYILLLVLFIRGFTLPGSTTGLRYFFVPNISDLLNIRVWVDAYVHVFYSLSFGYGFYSTYASYNRDYNSIPWRDSLLVLIPNVFTNIAATMTVATFMGFLAVEMNLPMNEVVGAGTTLVFVSFPDALARLPVAPAWCAIFFLMMFLIFVKSSFAQLEVMTTAICDEFPKTRKWRAVVMAAVVIVCFLLSLPTVTRGGIHVLSLLDMYASAVLPFFIVLFIILGFCLLYCNDKFKEDMQKMKWNLPWIILKITWLLYVPVIVLLVLAGSLYFRYDLKYPSWANPLGWCLATLPLLCIFVGMLLRFLMAPGSVDKKLRGMIRPSEEVRDQMPMTGWQGQAYYPVSQPQGQAPPYTTTNIYPQTQPYPPTQQYPVSHVNQPYPTGNQYPTNQLYPLIQDPSTQPMIAVSKEPPTEPNEKPEKM